MESCQAPYVLGKDIWRLAAQSAMLYIVVVSIPYFELSFQIIEIFESVLFIELLLIFTVTSLNITILGRFTRINEIVNDVVCSTELIKSVHLLWRKIFSFVAAVVSIGKCGVVICLDGGNGGIKSSHNLLEETY